MSVQITTKFKKFLHQKAWEMLAPVRTNMPAGGFFSGDKLDLLPSYDIFNIAGTSACYLYQADEGGWVQIPNSGAAGAFAAGACGYMNSIGMLGGSQTSTASAGTTTTATTARTITRQLTGCYVRCVGGTGIGYYGIIKSNTLGANSILTFYNAAAAPFDNTSVFQIFSGSLWFMNAGTVAVGLSVYDKATNAWTAKSVTNLPTAWGTDACLTFTPSLSSVRFRGTATAGGVNTLTDGIQAWATNYYAYCEILITAGTGIGQSNVIVSNTGTVLTLKNNWTTQPDATSTYTLFQREQGIASAFTGTTLSDSTKSWTSSQWINYQIRITAGTGIGQVRAITANTATQVTVSAWTVTPDATSTYTIEGNDDVAYLTGNAAVTMYKYSISGNSWATLSPGAARSSAPGAGMSLSWINEIDDSKWRAAGTPSAQWQNGRYLYSFRGSSSSALDIYDIAANTWISSYAYGNAMDVFSTGSSWCSCGKNIYGQQNVTGYFFKFDVLNNKLVGMLANLYSQSTAYAGVKVAVMQFYDDYNNSVGYMYWSPSNTNYFGRMALI